MRIGPRRMCRRRSSGCARRCAAIPPMGKHMPCSRLRCRRLAPWPRRRESASLPRSCRRHTRPGRKSPPGSELIPRGLERIKPSLEVSTLGRVDNAIATTGQREQKELAAFHLDRGRRFFDQGVNEEAITELRRALYLSPYEADAHLLLGRVYLRSGQRRQRSTRSRSRCGVRTPPRAASRSPRRTCRSRTRRLPGKRCSARSSSIRAPIWPRSCCRHCSVNLAIFGLSSFTSLRLATGSFFRASVLRSSHLPPAARNMHNDEGFREIQLNGKQLVFLFMAATVVSVVIFLCGVPGWPRCPRRRRIG